MSASTIENKEPETNETLSEELKIRLKPSQRAALCRVADRKGHLEASLGRHAIVQYLKAEGELAGISPDQSTPEASK